MILVLWAADDCQHLQALAAWCKDAAAEFETSPHMYLSVTCLPKFFMARELPVGQGLFIIKFCRSHSNTPQSVGLLWTSDQPVAETST